MRSIEWRACPSPASVANSSLRVHIPLEMRCRCAHGQDRHRVGRRWSARLHTSAGAHDNKVDARDGVTRSWRINRPNWPAAVSLFLSFSLHYASGAFLRLFLSAGDADSHLQRHYWNLSRRFVYCLFIYLSFDLSGQSNKKKTNTQFVLPEPITAGGAAQINSSQACISSPAALRRARISTLGPERKLCIIDTQPHPWELAVQSVPADCKFWSGNL